MTKAVSNSTNTIKVNHILSHIPVKRSILAYSFAALLLLPPGISSPLIQHAIDPLPSAIDPFPADTIDTVHITLVHLLHDAIDVVAGVTIDVLTLIHRAIDIFACIHYAIHILIALGFDNDVGGPASLLLDYAIDVGIVSGLTVHRAIDFRLVMALWHAIDFTPSRTSLFLASIILKYFCCHENYHERKFSSRGKEKIRP